VHTNIWTLKREEPQEGTWEGNWMKKALPGVGGKVALGYIYILGLYRHKYQAIFGKSSTACAQAVLEGNQS